MTFMCPTWDEVVAGTFGRTFGEDWSFDFDEAFFIQVIPDDFEDAIAFE